MKAMETKEAMKVVMGISLMDKCKYHAFLVSLTFSCFKNSFYHKLYFLKKKFFFFFFFFFFFLKLPRLGFEQLYVSLSLSLSLSLPPQKKTKTLAKF